MNNTAMIEMETQQRGQAFLRARKQALEWLEQKYNCTTTNVPKWLPNVSGTFVLGFDEQVLVGPVPMRLAEEKKEGE